MVKEGRIDNSQRSLALFLKSCGRAERQSVLEAGPNWTPMHDLLEELTGSVILAHPLKVRAIAEAKIKTDRIDAKILANLLRADLVPNAYVPGKSTREVKKVLRQRMFFVRLMTMTKNRIHTIIDMHPDIRAKIGTTDLFGSLGFNWLREVQLPEPERKLLDTELELLDYLKGLVRSSDRWVADFSKKDIRALLLKSIPGIGNFFAALIAVEIDDISRFRDPGKLASYAGLIPTLHQSGSKSYNGHITKQGNRFLRWALIEAVWPAIKADVGLKTHYEKIKNHKHANIAKVATARKITTIVYRVLTENRSYFPGRPQ